MKKLLTAIALLALLAGCSTEKTYKNKLEEVMGEKELVLITSPDYAPYEFIDASKTGQDQYVGADIELGKYIAEQLGVTLKIEAMDFDAVLAGISQGKGHVAISGLGYKKERAETMELSTVYNLSESSCNGLLVKKENNVAAVTDMNGKVVGAQNASLQQGYTEAQIPEAKLELVTSLNDGILMLQTNKIDALTISCTTGEQYAKSYPELMMADAKFAINDEDLGNVIAMQKGQVELLAKINEIVEKVVAEGMYAKWEKEATEYAEKLGQ